MQQVVFSSTFLHRLFRIGVFGKAIHGIVEIVGAIVIYVTSGTTIANILLSLTRNELAEDPNDLLANLVMQTTSHISQGAIDFAALYLFVGGIVNILIAVALLSSRRKLFPIGMGIVALFALYESYLFAKTLSLWLPALILYDLVILYLIYNEYRTAH